MRALVAALMLAIVAAWVACFAAVFGDESPAARAVDGVGLLLGVAVLTGLSFLVWPRGA